MSDITFWNRVATPTQNDSTDLPFVSRGVLLFATGTIRFDTETGQTQNWTIPATAPLPYFVPVYVKRIHDTGTSIADADMRIGS
jgi:hypothetical protein